MFASKPLFSAVVIIGWHKSQPAIREPNLSATMPQEYRDGISKSLHSQAGAGRERQLRYNAAGRLSEKLDGEWLSRDRALYYLALKP